MKKSTMFINLMVVVFLGSFVACSSPAPEEAPAEETVVEEAVVEEPVVEEVVDTTAAATEEAPAE
jgi:Na+-transporting methylmalonyl-CoA/oxaloacetate decarboxylase gamma subunit